MAKYGKPLKSIEVHTIGGAVITASDTAEKPIATWAYDEFCKEKPMHILADPKDYVPYHAVDYLVLTQSSVEMDKKDAYGCGGSTVGDAQTCSAETE